MLSQMLAFALTTSTPTSNTRHHLVRPARRAVRAESSALSRGAEGRPPMPERRAASGTPCMHRPPAGAGGARGEQNSPC
eukprot:scaffold4992_cov63-Phaeocystis_antarctica.AAC.3